MKFKVQLIAYTDEGQEETIYEIVELEKLHHRVEHIGLTLTDAKHLLTQLQLHVVGRQTAAFLASHVKPGAPRYGSRNRPPAPYVPSLARWSSPVCGSPAAHVSRIK